MRSQHVVLIFLTENYDECFRDEIQRRGEIVVSSQCTVENSTVKLMMKDLFILFAF